MRDAVEAGRPADGRPAARPRVRRLLAGLFALAGAGALAGCGSSEIAEMDPTLGVVPSPKVAGSRNIPAGGGVRKLGEPYRIAGRWYHPKHDENYDEKGVASWYGKAFHGRQTANGEVFDMHDLTAAHPTLPMPSYVRVTNLANDRSVIVRVNDRGPFSRSRIIDLSAKAAELLDFKHHGTARVRVRYVGPAKLDPKDHDYLLASYRGPGAKPRDDRGSDAERRAPRRTVPLGVDGRPERNVLIASRTAGPPADRDDDRAAGGTRFGFWPFGKDEAGEGREERATPATERPAATAPRPATGTAPAARDAPKASGSDEAPSREALDALILMSGAGEGAPASSGGEAAAEPADADSRIGAAHAAFGAPEAEPVPGAEGSPTLDALTLVEAARSGS